jgi:hypothetical protein
MVGGKADAADVADAAESVAWVERKRNPGLPFTNPKRDLQNQQGRSSFQQGDVKRWLMANGHFHERRHQRL